MNSQLFRVVSLIYKSWVLYTTLSFCKRGDLKSYDMLKSKTRVEQMLFVFYSGQVQLSLSKNFTRQTLRTVDPVKTTMKRRFVLKCYVIL